MIFDLYLFLNYLCFQCAIDAVHVERGSTATAEQEGAAGDREGEEGEGDDDGNVKCLLLSQEKRSLINAWTPMFGNRPREAPVGLV